MIVETEAIARAIEELFDINAIGRDPLSTSTLSRLWQATGLRQSDLEVGIHKLVEDGKLGVSDIDGGRNYVLIGRSRSRDARRVLTSRDSADSIAQRPSLREVVLRERRAGAERRTTRRRDDAAENVVSVERRAGARNRLLSSLSPSLQNTLAPHLKVVQMPKGKQLWEIGDRLTQVYFPIDCIILLAHTMADGCSNEVAVVGNESVTSISASMGSVRAPTSAVVLHPGTALCMNVDRLRDEFNKGGEMQSALLRYSQVLLVQVAQTAACFRHHSVQQQVSRLLLACTDRIRSRRLVMTHEVIAGLLGVRRVSVTEVLGRLRAQGLITCERGGITVVDIGGLKQSACECYAAVKKEVENMRSITVQ